MIPVIDLQHLDQQALDAACQHWGFFFLEGHDIDASLTTQSLKFAERFFQSPPTVKNQVRRSAKNSWGFNDSELTKNKRDWKEILDIGPPVHTGPLAGSTPQWPALPGFKDTISELSDALHQTALTIVEHIVRVLNAELDIAAAFAEHSSFLRLNFYPPCTTPVTDNVSLAPDSGELGISHHTDAGAITVLVQDGLPGLQVYNSGRWVDPGSARGRIIINIGDIVQVWSNDRYRAPLHRVVANAGTKRLSIPYFLNPSYEFNYAPLVGEPHYRAINWGEFRSRRSAGDYADLGSEVQIADYALSAK